MITIDAHADGGVTHVVYHPVTGRVLGTMRHDRDPGQGQGGCRCAEDRAMLGAFADDTAGEQAPLPRLLDAPASLPERLGHLRVDPASRRLLPLPRLVIDPERRVMEGDGEDTVTLEIRAVDEQGAVLEDFSGEVHVRTARGKLSARGGSVRLEGGRATLTLTSVAETVDDVPVVVSAPGGVAATARASLTFA